MKVVFFEDVPDVARAGEIKEVADGYGRNYLIPRKLAAPAVAENINAIGAKVANRIRSVAKTEGEFAEVAAQIDGREVFIEAKSGGKDRLYGSITNSDIAAAIEKSTGVVVDKRKIKLDEQIHQLGSYEITIRLYKGITPTVRVTVTESSEK